LSRFRPPSLSRRHVLGLGVGVLALTHVRPTRASEGGAEAHGMSAFGDLNYPADFQHFDYINPAAPKGGTFSLIPSVRAYNQSFFTFNSFNAFILKGEGAQGMDMTFMPLMARANDEPDAMYGLAAKSVWISADKLTYRFTMRPEAKFHDGSRLTARDAAFSLTTLKEKGHPLIIVQLRDLVKAEAIDDATLVVTFAEKRAPNFPLNTLPFVPLSTLTGNLRYEQPLGTAGTLAFNANYYWTGDINFYAYTARSYGLANLRLDWNDVGGKPIDLSAYVKNVTDKEYVAAPGLTAAAPGVPLQSVLFGQPRTFGVQLRVRFGEQQ